MWCVVKWYQQWLVLKLQSFTQLFPKRDINNETNRRSVKCISEIKDLINCDLLLLILYQYCVLLDSFLTVLYYLLRYLHIKVELVLMLVFLIIIFINTVIITVLNIVCVIHHIGMISMLIMRYWGQLIRSCCLLRLNRL